jgi:pimeloyl-ACP methyl ester carboxylesterase
MMRSEFLPERNGYRIPAVFSDGDNSGSNGASDVVILCHGISTDKNEYLDFLVTLEQKLKKRGISTLRFDFRGHGESGLPPSAFSIASQIIDLVAAVQWIKARSPNSRISFFGVSFGAPPCLMIERWAFDTKFGPRFLLAPVLSYDRTFLNPESNWAIQNFSSEAQKNALAGSPIYLNDHFYMNGELFAEMAAMDIGKSISECNSPIYVMHGTEDDMVPFDISKQISEKEGNVELIEFPGMEHGFTAKGDETGLSEATLLNIEKIIDTVQRGLGRVR